MCVSNRVSTTGQIIKKKIKTTAKGIWIPNAYDRRKYLEFSILFLPILSERFDSISLLLFFSMLSLRNIGVGQVTSRRFACVVKGVSGLSCSQWPVREKMDGNQVWLPFAKCLSLVSLVKLGWMIRKILHGLLDKRSVVLLFKDAVSSPNVSESETCLVFK